MAVRLPGRPRIDRAQQLSRPMCVTFDNTYPALGDCAAPNLLLKGWPATVSEVTAHGGASRPYAWNAMPQHSRHGSFAPPKARVS